MKKALCTLALASCFVSAYSDGGDSGQAVEIPLTVSCFDPSIGVKPGRPKSPIQPPYVTLDDHTLYIWSQHNGYTVTLLDDNGTVVYQTYIYAGTQMVSLPTTLSGSYTLQLSDDTFVFTGVLYI